MDASISIKELTDQWKTTVLSLKWANQAEAHKIMDSADRGPSYWRTLVGLPKLTELVAEIERIKKNFMVVNAQN